MRRIERIRQMHRDGILGGHTMPEDANPGLAQNSAENALFFTLPMALNYQRNSYALWPEAKKAYEDSESRRIFEPSAVRAMDEEELRNLLMKYKVALQPNKHTEIWRRVSRGILLHGEGDVRKILANSNYSVTRLRQFMQVDHKSDFPYLCGPKIFNYWLYVLEQYASIKFVDREEITIAPDTHVIQASIRLGLIDAIEAESANARELVATRWRDVLKGTGLASIDVHTPLWLWSRASFPN